MQYLLKSPHHGTFYFRIVIPTPIRSYFNGKTEIKKSLHTTDRTNAIHRAASYITYTKNLFEQIEKRNVAAEWDNIFSKCGLTPPIAVMNTEPQSAMTTLDTALLSPLPPTSTPSPSAIGAQAHAQAPAGITLTGLIEDYCREMTAATPPPWTRKTENENRAIYAVLLEFLGDIPVADITHIMSANFSKLLQSLPPNIRKNKHCQGKSLAEIVANPPGKPMSTSNVNKYIRRVSQLFHYAKRHHHISENWFAGTQIGTKKSALSLRASYTTSQLLTLFAQDIFTDHKCKHAYQYWLPLLGLYTGARLEELCQLHLYDIQEVEGIWVFNVNDDGTDKRLKTVSSRRLIPIHSRLIDLNFLGYVQKLRKQGHTRLFPELVRGRDGYGQVPSKWYGRLRDRLGWQPQKPNLDFHSFRHTVANALKQCGQQQAHISALLGHLQESVTIGIYGDNFAPPIMKKLVEKLEFAASTASVKPYRL